MRVRAFHPVGFFASHLKAPHLCDLHPLLTRCLDPLFKHILPTLLILCYIGVIALYLGGLIDQSKQEHRQGKLDKGYAIAQ